MTRTEHRNRLKGRIFRMNARNLIGAIERVGNPIINAITVPILESRWSWLLERFIVTISYSGRRSGKYFSTPVLYSEHGDTVNIRVASPDSKRWWRNFLDDGAPITVHFPDATRTGHATSRRGHRGFVIVHIDLDPEFHVDR